jgi:flavodoxin I
MSEIGLFYSFKSLKTRKIAGSIIEQFGMNLIESVDAESVAEEDFMRFDKMILGVPTWFDGELPVYWDEFVPALKDLDLSGKKIAVFGLGDQKGYPENFGDAVGIMAELVTSGKAELVGETSPAGYIFESSRALMDGKFRGLILDQENQPRLTEKRVQDWCIQLKMIFADPSPHIFVSRGK